MWDALRDFGISESGIDGPALYLVVAGLACLIVNTQVRNRAPDASGRILTLLYVGAILLAASMMWLAFRIESENARYVVALVYLGVLTFGARLIGRKYLGVRDEAPEDGPKKPKDGA